MNPASLIRRAGLCLGVAFAALAITLGANQTSRVLPGPRQAVRGVRRVRAAAAGERRAGLHGRGDRGAARDAEDVPVAAGGDRHVGLAGRAAGGSRAGRRRDERARLRPARAPAVGARSGVLQVASGPGRATRRRTKARRITRSIELWTYTFPLSAADERAARAGARHDSAAPRAGAREPHRQCARSLGHGHGHDGGAGRRPRRAGQERVRGAAPTLDAGDSGRAHGDGRLRAVARAAGAVEDRAVRRRQGGTTRGACATCSSCR